MSLSEGDALFVRIQENIADQAPQLIYADWLEENDREVEAQSWRGAPKDLFRVYSLYAKRNGFGLNFNFLNSGHGEHYGDGYDAGFGRGHGILYPQTVPRRSAGPVSLSRATASRFTRFMSSGFGDGQHCGDGIRDGTGSGYGYSAALGSGIGGGTGDSMSPYTEQLDYEGLKSFLDENESIIGGKIVLGQNMLIWAGAGFAWVGKVEEMYINGGYRLSNAGMLCRTGGDSWMHVADGTRRNNYVYRHAPKGVVYTAAPIHGAILWEGDLPGEDKN